jgi:hypothetical protein
MHEYSLFFFPVPDRKLFRILQDGDEGLNKKILADIPTKTRYDQV